MNGAAMTVMGAPMSVRPDAGAAHCGRQRHYNQRATHRLVIAARLLHHRGLTVDVLGDAFCPAVLHLIQALNEIRRERLRGLVDWVEAYEDAEAGPLDPRRPRREARRPGVR